MIERTEERFDPDPQRLAGDTAHGSAEGLAWLIHERGSEPHLPVFDKSKRTDGSFSRDEFADDHQGDVDSCPAGRCRPARCRASECDGDPCRLKAALLS